MADTKQGREKQARDAERRQREREIEEERERADEAAPAPDGSNPVQRGEVGAEVDDPESPRSCHRRGCDEPAAFLVLERYLEETGQGPVEARAYLCADHTGEECPTNLDHAYEEYVFRIEPIPGHTASSPP
ncbi:hypothetical protein ACFO0N_07175 [Halobium salinum]|uniref:Uncharacterized protein n=1 Tax=Halobium salinum TaxID=1364940 RepID=A0ABD5PA05_9EURY|nr:hypothetical protein [Halobium salinum]